MNWNDFTAAENLERPRVALAEDRGKARDLRDMLIGQRHHDRAAVTTVTDRTHLGIAEERLARLVDHYDWFARDQIGNVPAVRATDAAHRALREDEFRRYADVAGHPYGGDPTEVPADD